MKDTFWVVEVPCPLLTEIHSFCKIFSASMGAKQEIFRSIVLRRKTCQRFQPGKVIPEKTKADILRSALRSPSSFNLQPSQIIFVESQAVKHSLSDHAMLGIGNKYRVQQASAVAVFLSDLEPTKRINRIYHLEKCYRNPNYRASFPLSASFLIGEGHAATFIKGIATDLMSSISAMPQIESVQAWSYKNTSLLAQTYVYAAESHDLATAMMEGYDQRRVKEILRVPDRYAIPLMVATGYEYQDEGEGQPATPRLDINETVFSDVFGDPYTSDSNDKIKRKVNDVKEKA